MSNENPKTLVLWIDALHSKYLDPEHCPFMSRFAKENNFSLLKTHLGFSTSIGASFFTGKYPRDHGNFYLFWKQENRILRFLSLKPRSAIDLVNNLFRLLSGKTYFSTIPKYIPRFRMHFFDVSLDKNFSSPDSLEVPTIFDLFRENNISFTFYKWPFYGTEKKTKYELFKKHDTQAVSTRLLDLLKQNKDFYFLYLVELDIIGHDGPDNPNHLAKMKEIDESVKTIVTKFKTLHPDGNIILWSDHGMAPVKGKVDVRAAVENLNLKFGKDYLYFLDSTAARFWFLNKEAEQKIRAALAQVSHGHILDDNELKSFGVNFSHNKYGDLIFLLDEGYLIAPNYFSGNKNIKGMHGYSPEFESMRGFLMADTNIDLGKKEMRDVTEGFGILKKIYGF